MALLATALADATGSWEGSNGFRLMPSDALAELPASATLTLAAGGHLAAFAYTWTHPDAGPHDGLLVVGSAGDEAGGLVGLWGDSWHQQPVPMSMTGTVEGHRSLRLAAGYDDGWEWRIALEVEPPDRLTMRMENVVPVSAATEDLAGGPYAAMLAELRRTR